ncbi:hypothetical protein NL676_007462 [Syzygium grande]|nr:hypothetical protein NL676_007462 [Syzygium grande]
MPTVRAFVSPSFAQPSSLPRDEVRAPRRRSMCVVISVISCIHSYWHGAVSVARRLFDQSSIPECSLLDEPVGINVVELPRLIVRYVL